MKAPLWASDSISHAIKTSLGSSNYKLIDTYEIRTAKLENVFGSMNVVQLNTIQEECSYAVGGPDEFCQSELADKYKAYLESGTTEHAFLCIHD